MKTNNSCINRSPMPAGAIEPNSTAVNGMLEFAGCYWWTNYPFNISNSGYWFINQQWDPRGAYVDAEGLHLKMKQSQLPNGPSQWSSVSLVLWGYTANNPNTATHIPTRSYPGFGRYLIAAETPNGTFDQLSNQCCFGAFTYQFEADNTITNSHRELDMLECSRWYNPKMSTNAQFTLQPWENDTNNVHRISIDSSKSQITLLMDWQDENTAVTFNLYYGLYTFSNLPATPDITWTTAANQNQFIPNEGCQTVHLNLWRQPQGKYPASDQEVIIKNFQYAELS